MNRTNGFSKFPADDPPSELLRVVVLCHPSWVRLPRTTFSPDVTSSPIWLRWKEDIFHPVILPAIEGAQLACATGDGGALCGWDKAIDAVLTPKEREASRLAGAALIDGYRAPKSERLWTRYRSLVQSGEVPGHLAIICALRAAAFHLPVLTTASAYVFLEAKGGLPRSEVALWMNMVGDCLAARQASDMFNLRAA
jgi:UreF